jgi:hypothetical protein
MSILSHQSAVNPTLNFWGTGSSVSGTAVLAQTSTNVSINDLQPNEYFYIPLFPLPELPYDGSLDITLNWVFIGVIDFDSFTIGVEKDGVVVCEVPLNLTISKGAFGTSIVASETFSANVPFEIKAFLKNNTATTDPLTLDTFLGSTTIITVTQP